MSTRGVAETAQQMVLDLSRAPSFDPDDFLVSATNESAHALLMAWPEWPSRTLLLIGPPGAGKSHLSAIWAGRAGARPFVAGGFDWSVGDGEVAPTWLIENADRCKPPEPALFHLLNLIEERCGWLVITARAPPDCWRLRTPDLLSRLRRAPIASLGHPDEELLRAVLLKLFSDRQIWIAADVLSYAATHCEQSLDAASKFVAAVDEAALAEGRRITRPLAARTLATLATRSEAAQAEDYGPT